ncbi:hypothetical protein BJV74DRAFT_849027 [Russula compacta]|nr:hypothetical protein BJV74DRAFT_849027 [Russula compacta]
MRWRPAWISSYVSGGRSTRYVVNPMFGCWVNGGRGAALAPIPQVVAPPMSCGVGVSRAGFGVCKVTGLGTAAPDSSSRLGCRWRRLSGAPRPLRSLAFVRGLPSLTANVSHRLTGLKTKYFFSRIPFPSVLPWTLSLEQTGSPPLLCSCRTLDSVRGVSKHIWELSWPLGRCTPLLLSVFSGTDSTRGEQELEGSVGQLPSLSL